MSACSPVLRTLASRAPQLARVPSFLPFSSRASSSSSAPSPSARDALTEPEPAPAPFGLQTQDDRDQPKRRHAFSQPETVRPKLRPIESLSNTRVYVTNLPFDFPEDQLGALFENLTECSPIDATHAPRSRTKGKARVRNVGYGFVEWEDDREGWDAVWKAVGWSGKVEVEGKTLTIVRAAPKLLPSMADRRPEVADAWSFAPHLDPSSSPSGRPRASDDGFVLPPSPPLPPKQRKRGMGGGWDD